MEKVITLLGERNKYLSKFCALNTIEVNKLAAGDFDSIEAFYSAREGILEIVKQIETMIDKRMQALGEFSNVAPSIKRLVADSLKERDHLVTMILNQDLEIMSYIDQAKNSIIIELQTLRKGRRLISSYKSGSRTKVLDEEL